MLYSSILLIYLKPGFVQTDPLHLEKMTSFKKSPDSRGNKGCAFEHPMRHCKIFINHPC